MLRRLVVQNCRNIERTDLTLSTGLNLFLGPNGAGKTALLEAVHVLARGRSFRGAQMGSVIRHGERELIVRGVLGSRDGAQENVATLAVARPRRGAARVHYRDTPLEGGIAAASRLLPLQSILPGVSDLVFGAPSERRRWLDWGVFHVKPSYLAAWRAYGRLLKQRNALLRAPQPQLDLEVLEALTEQLSRHAEPLTRARAAYIEGWQPHFREHLSRLDATLTDLTLHALPIGRGSETSDPLHKILSESVARDVKSGATQSGPHRYELDLRHHDRPLAEQLSRGQGKTVALALKLSQSAYLRQETGQRSVFLIDDAGAELDRTRNRAFFQLLADLDSQVLATGTEAPWTGDAYQGEQRTVFHVEQGEVHPALG